MQNLEKIFVTPACQNLVKIFLMPDLSKFSENFHDTGPVEI